LKPDPLIVTEIGAWIQRTWKPGQSDIWRAVRDKFVAMKMDEGAIKFLEMQFELVADQEVTDASVVHLALELAARSPKVLALDTAPTTECKRSGVDTVHLYEVIA